MSLPRTGFVAMLVAVLPLSALARPCEDLAALAAARTQVAAECDCASAPSAAVYRSCAKGVAAALVASGALPATCRNEVRRCATRSTCGRTDRVTCCTVKNGRSRCRVTTAARCTARGGCVGAVASCCDACDGGGCVTTTTTTLPEPVCGNGIIEGNEQCDGQAICNSTCGITRNACCSFGEVGDVCGVAVPAVTLRSLQFQVCPPLDGGTFHMGLVPSGSPACSTPIGGGSDGGCIEAPPLDAPITLCCYGRSTTGENVCTTITSAERTALDLFHYECAALNYPAIPLVVGTCGDGGCVPAGG